MNDHLHALPAGFQIQEYELIRVLGSGGFGITYLAFDNNMDRGCAIKEYLPNDLAVRDSGNSVLAKSTAAQEEFDWGLDRFLFEARTLARFDHRNIVKVYRSFSAHGTGYIVMEYAEGETLSELFARKGKLNETELKAILIPMLEGLAEVHATDFLHRDIKPGNIIIRDSDQSAVLLDFGSARQAIGVKSRSVTAIVSAGYAPIEQYSTKGNQGPWTDIYALGALCYRALTGQVPDDATERVRRDPLIPISDLCGDKVSADFLKAVDWALQVDEEARPQNVKDWLDAISGADLASVKEIDRATAATPKHTPPQIAAEGSNKNAKAFASVMAVAIVTAGIAIWYFYPSSDEIVETIPDQLVVTSESEPDDSTTDDLTTTVVTPEVDVVSIPDLEMVLISQGGFTMGDSQGSGDADELPIRELNFDKDFYLSMYEITFSQYDKFANDTGRELPDDEGWGRDNRPVVNVSWQDATAYAQWLSNKTEQLFRLPSEAEWEYVAKLGSATDYPWGSGIQSNRANCKGCGGDGDLGRTQVVGSFAANQTGLYDMQGNVWEWVQDCAHDGYSGAPEDGSAWEAEAGCSRVTRGGSWDSTPFQLRSSYRNWQPAEDYSNKLGIRVLREVQ